MRLKTLLIGIGTLVVAAAVAVVFVTSATAATTVPATIVPETMAVEAQSSKDYALGENCPLSGHGDTI